MHYALITIDWYLFLLPPNQHGFPPNHSAVSALLPLAHNKAQAHNQASPQAIDLTKTFDMVKLISALTLSPLNNITPNAGYLPAWKGVLPAADTTIQYSLLGMKGKG